MALQKRRRDHYLPQGYLRGFIDPARENEPQPLWKLDIASRKWAERSTKQVAHLTGFYDYAGASPELESLPSSDETFSELENQFPAVRAKLLSLRKKTFRNWTKHLPFLLRYMDMLRARSPLYFTQREAAWKSTPTWKVAKVIDAHTIELASMEASPPPDEFIKNRTIFQMREEIQKNGAWLWELNWVLRYTESVSEPFVISESPFLAEISPGVAQENALKHPETVLYFPLCWEVCLFGSPVRFDLGTGKLDSHDMTVARRKYRVFAKQFLISPAKLDDITDFPKTRISRTSPLDSAVRHCSTNDFYWNFGPTCNPFRLCWNGGWPTFNHFYVQHFHRGCPILAFLFARVGVDDACAIRFVT